MKYILLFYSFFPLANDQSHDLLPDTCFNSSLGEYYWISVSGKDLIVRNNTANSNTTNRKKNNKHPLSSRGRSIGEDFRYPVKRHQLIVNFSIVLALVLSTDLLGHYFKNHFHQVQFPILVPLKPCVLLCVFRI